MAVSVLKHYKNGMKAFDDLTNLFRYYFGQLKGKNIIKEDAIPGHMKAVDYLVQSILLTTSLQDREFALDEKIFIEDCSKNAQLIDALSLAVNSKETWNSFYKAGIIRQKQLYNLYKPHMMDLTNQLILTLAYGSLAIKDDFLSKAAELLLQICSSFLYIDGSSNDEELHGNIEAIQKFFIDRVMEMRKALQAQNK